MPVQVAHFRRGASRRTILLFGAVFLAWASAADANAQTAARMLPAHYTCGTTINVVIDLDAPAGIGVVGVEDSPPAGWTVSSVSHSGAFDAQTGKVKWGPFFDPSIPEFVTYDVTSPATSSREGCFGGFALFDTTEVAIVGSECVAGPVPAASMWGLVLLALLVVVAGTVVLNERFRTQR